MSIPSGKYLLIKLRWVATDEVFDSDVPVLHIHGLFSVSLLNSHSSSFLGKQALKVYIAYFRPNFPLCLWLH